jgi:hypothetical protein
MSTIRHWKRSRRKPRLQGGPAPEAWIGIARAGLPAANGNLVPASEHFATQVAESIGRRAMPG